MLRMYDILEALAPSEECVSFKEFVQGEDYCNAQGVYDYWIEEGNALNDPVELILDGSLGGGKSTFAAYYTANRLYKLLRIPNLRKYLGIIDGSAIYILYFSVSITAARRSGFQTLMDIIDKNIWFQRHFPRDKNIQSSIRFPGGISIEYASSEGHQIGLNVIGFILDEGTSVRE